MIQFTDFVQIVADSFFGGSIYVGGMVVLLGILALVIAFSKKLITTMIVGIPLTMLFSYMRIIPDEITLVLLVVIVLGLAYTAKGVTH